MTDTPEASNSPEGAQNFNASQARADFQKDAPKTEERKHDFDGKRFMENRDFFNSLYERTGISTAEKERALVDFFQQERDLFIQGLNHAGANEYTMEILQDLLQAEEMPTVQALGLEFVQQNLEFMERVVEAKPNDDVIALNLETVAIAAKIESPDRTEPLLGFLKRMKHPLLDGLKSHRFPSHYYGALSVLADGSGKAEVSVFTDEVIKGLLKEAERDPNGMNIVEGMFRAFSTEPGSFHQEEKYGLVPTTLFSDFGFDYGELADSWSKSSSVWKYHEVLRLNISSMMAVELREPGSTKVLSAEFGIKNFGRYPPELLVRQYREREKTDKPYGIGLYPTHDHNGASYGQRYPLESLISDLGDDYSMRVYEVEDKLAIARVLKSANRKFGKATFGIVFGHGKEDSIDFGTDPKNPTEKTAVSINDLNDPRFARLQDYFVPKPTIILASCSTGAKEGIGQKLFEKFGADIIAPEVDSGVKAYHAKREDGRLIITAEYTHAEGQAFARQK